MPAYRGRTRGGSRPTTRRRRIAGLSLTAGLLFGCNSTPDPLSPQSDEQLPTSTFVDARPAAIIDGYGVLWGDLRDILSEAAGASALQDIILDRRAAKLLADRGRDVTEMDAEAEEQRLLRTLSDDPDVAIRLLQELRASEGLGPRRYRNLLWRNARLRALVRDDVTLDEPAIRDLFDAFHGATRQVRLITTSQLRVAELARTRVAAGASFAEVATELSTDTSAARGGLLEPVSRRDRTWPGAIRDAIWRLDANGDISDPIVIDNGFAIVQLVKENEADGVTLAEARPDLERRLRLQRERVRMDELARQLLADATVTIYDRSLRAAWERRATAP